MVAFVGMRLDLIDFIFLEPDLALYETAPKTNKVRPQIRTATKRAGGSTKNNRGSAGRRLGVKKFGGQSSHQR